MSLLLAGLGLGFASPAHAVATFTVNNLDGAGEGFNDATPFTPVGGNPATTVGAARLLAFRHAAFMWGTCLTSAVQIQINATFDTLTCTSAGAVLGQAGPTNVFANFSGAPIANTLYTQAEANSKAGVDLDPTTPDITAAFSSNLDDPSCLGATKWYYGLDGNPPAGDIDFVTVVFHEIGHGLGVLSLVNLTTGAKLAGFNDAYMVNLERHGATPPDYPSMTNAQRVAASKSDPNLHWLGTAVNTRAAAIPLTAGMGLGGHVRMHGPAVQAPGSSVSHFSNALAPNETLEPFYSGPNHNPGLAKQLLEDIGWTMQPKVGTDVVFILDVTGSTGALLPNWVSQIPNIAQSWQNYDPTARFALASHADFPFSPYGDAGIGDYAYRADMAFTSSIPNLQAALAGLTQKYGADSPESQYEAIYQVLTGAGRDLGGAVNYSDPGEFAPSPLGQLFPMAIYLFTWPEEFHNRDTDANYPFAGSNPVAGETAVTSELAIRSSMNMFFGLTFISGLQSVIGTPNQPPGPLESHVRGPLVIEGTGPLQALADITGGEVLDVGTDLSQLQAAIDESIAHWSVSPQATGDLDADGLLYPDDNCPQTYNPTQLDVDGDGVGDACDNCPGASSADQSDRDLDGHGDVCDNCPASANTAQANADGDAYGDACDCAPSNPALFVKPDEATNLALPSKVLITWNAAPYATTHDIVRGALNALPVGPGGGDETCFNDLPGLSMTDSVSPSPGSGFWYVVNGGNACGSGVYGFQGVSGNPMAPRLTTTCP